MFMVKELTGQFSPKWINPILKTSYIYIARMGTVHIQTESVCPQANKSASLMQN